MTDAASERAMRLYHRIAHLERAHLEHEEPGDWATAAAALDAHARERQAHPPEVGLRLVRIDEAAAIAMLSGPSRDAIARAWVDVVVPWLDAHGLVLVESVFEGDELLCIDARDEAADDAGTTGVDAFVRAVVASSTVWGLYGKTWARSDAAGDTEALPLWPDPVAAARCIAGPWAGFAPRAIELSAFREQWLTGMDEDGIVAVISPSPGDPGTIVMPAQLSDQLSAQLSDQLSAQLSAHLEPHDHDDSA